MDITHGQVTIPMGLSMRKNIILPPRRTAMNRKEHDAPVPALTCGTFVRETPVHLKVFDMNHIYVDQTGNFTPKYQPDSLSPRITGWTIVVELL